MWCRASALRNGVAVRQCPFHRLPRELRGFPGGQTAGNLADQGESLLLQQAGSDRRSIAARAVDDQRPIFRQLAAALGRVVEWDADAAADEFLRALRRGSDVDGERMSGGEAVGRERRADALGGRGQLRPRREGGPGGLQVADDVIETDAAETNRRLVFAAGVGDDDDRPLTIEDGAGPGRVLAAEADVQAAGKVRGGEV